jgi:HK97 family phage major capsid protein
MKETDASVVRNALQEGDGGEGGYLVPNDYYNRMIELRDQASFPRRMGVQSITTERDVIDIPAEGTSFTKFSRTAEEGTYSTNDPAFVQNQVTPQKWTKSWRVSEELIADNAYDLTGFLTRAAGRAMAQTENYYVAIGSGTNQHEGIFEGGDTDALTFDSTGNITPDEIWELFYTLGAGYRGQAAWLMDDQTWRYILSIRDANNWAFAAADMATIGAGSNQPDGMLCGKPVF